MTQQTKRTAVVLDTLRLSEEGGAVGAGGIAGAAMPLFATLVARSAPKRKKTKKRNAITTEAVVVEGDDASESPDMAHSKPAAEQRFDQESVISKLKGLEAREKTDKRDLVTFGLEDDDGGIVRVSVKSEQAAEFEKALQSFAGQDPEDADGKSAEIAEVLFKLKDHFDIVDVVWPEVVEDEEQVGDIAGDGDIPPEDGDLGGMEGEVPPMDVEGGGSHDQTVDLLTQVIDMMKADAEARKSEAVAREAEAKAKQADAIIAQTMARVKQEEQYLDMESYQRSRKEEDKEAKRLAQLAKWKHEVSNKTDDFEAEPSASAPLVPRPDETPEENEEHTRPTVKPHYLRPKPQQQGTGKMAPRDIAQYIIGRVK